MNTYTPRTDSQAVRYYDDASGNRVEYIPSRFGRQLERELAQITKSLKEKRCEFCGELPQTENDFMIPENTDTPQKADCPSAPCSPSWFVNGAEYRERDGWIEARNNLNPEWVIVDKAEKQI